MRVLDKVSDIYFRPVSLVKKSTRAVLVPARRSGGGSVHVSAREFTDWKSHTYVYEENLVGGPDSSVKFIIALDSRFLLLVLSRSEVAVTWNFYLSSSRYIGKDSDGGRF